MISRVLPWTGRGHVAAAGPNTHVAVHPYGRVTSCHLSETPPILSNNTRHTHHPLALYTRGAFRTSSGLTQMLFILYTSTLLTCIVERVDVNAILDFPPLITSTGVVIATRPLSKYASTNVASR